MEWVLKVICWVSNHEMFYSDFELLEMELLKMSDEQSTGVEVLEI